MNSKADATQLSTAREIVAKDYERFGCHSSARSVRAGQEDDHSEMRCALAAIIETTEAAAKHAAGMPPYVHAADVAWDFRNGYHLKAPQP